MPNTSGDEKRRGLRVDFKTRIIIKIGEEKIQVEGSSKDLSLKGVFINTTEQIPIGSKCQVDIILTGMLDEIALQMQGDAVRKTGTGVAIDFNFMDIDSYTHLKNIVKYNASGSDNPDDVH